MNRKKQLVVTDLKTVKRLDPEKNDEGVYIYKRKLQGLYRIYIPQDSA